MSSDRLRHSSPRANGPDTWTRSIPRRSRIVSDAMVTRSVVLTDFARWKPLWDGYNRFYGRAGALALSDTIKQTTWSRFFDVAEPVHALVAEQGGQLLGLAH